MHDFNSVSGTWSHTQLKGRGGRRGDKCKEWRERGEREERSDEEGHRFGWRRWRRGHSSSLPPLSLVGFWTGRGPAERGGGGKEKVEESRAMAGRGRRGFCLLPTFQSQSWKMNRQRKINCMTFTERKREIEKAGRGGREGGVRQIMEGGSERKKERLKGEKVKWPVMFIPILCCYLFAQRTEKYPPPPPTHLHFIYISKDLRSEYILCGGQFCFYFIAFLNVTWFCFF